MDNNSGCRYYAARIYLIVWTILCVVGTLLTSFNENFGTRPGSAAVLLVNVLVVLGSASFTLFAAYKMDRKLLRIAFWVQLANMGTSIVLQLINVNFLDPLEKSSGQEIGIEYSIIASVLVLMIQGKTRTCLLVWTCIIAGRSAGHLMFSIVTGDFDFTNHAVLSAIVLVQTLMATFIMVAAYKMEARLLQIAFWLPFASIGLLVLYITAVIGGSSFNNAVIHIIHTSIYEVPQHGLLAWAIRKAVKEAKEIGITVQASYIPCHIDV